MWLRRMSTRISYFPRVFPTCRIRPCTDGEQNAPTGSGRQRDDLGIAQARQMVEGGHPLTYIVPDMAVQNTAARSCSSLEPIFAKEMTRRVEHDRLTMNH